jgi:hypothetical protein
MANIFKPKRSNTGSSIPTISNLIDGELAVNSADKKIYLRDGSSVIEISNYTNPDSFLRSDVSDVKTSGDLRFNDNVKLNLGTGDDLQIYHDGSVNNIQTTGSTNLNISTSSGNVGINSTSPSEKLDVNGNIAINQTTVFGSDTATLSTTTQTSIHSNLSSSVYRTVEYLIQVTRGTDYHVSKMVVLNDGSNIFFNEYATVFSNSSLASFEVDVFNGNIRLLATNTTASQTNFVVNYTSIKV